MTPEDYKKWTASNTSGMSLAQNGERLFASMGCNACHSGNCRGARAQPCGRLQHSHLALTDGSTMVANEAYLRETILNPSQHVTAGYAPIMPTYQGQISEDGLIDLVEYMKSLNSNYRLQQTMNKSDLDSAQPAPIGRNQGRERPLQCTMRSTQAMSTIVSLPDQSTAKLPSEKLSQPGVWTEELAADRRP